MITTTTRHACAADAGGERGDRSGDCGNDDDKEEEDEGDEDEEEEDDGDADKDEG